MRNADVPGLVAAAYDPTVYGIAHKNGVLCQIVGDRISITKMSILSERDQQK